jgi:oligoendopeptidase F
VTTLLHEAGHAFHAFLSSRWPLVWQRGHTTEAAELASMSMELLAGPLLAAPTGYYSPAEAAIAELLHLEDILLFFPHCASVDAFQRWVYRSGQGGDAAVRDDAWRDIRARFERGVDWRGLEAERAARWYKQLHIFELPFYYIEYGIAQLGALQVWRNAQRDPSDALARYKSALRLGLTATLEDTYREAGARLIFDADGMREIVALVEARMAHLRAEIDRSGR